jgi:hypothetical protein
MKTAAWAITILSWVALCCAIVPQTLPDPGRMVHIPDEWWIEWKISSPLTSQSAI